MNQSTKRNAIRQFLFSLLIFVGFYQWQGEEVSAQSIDQWTPHQRVPGIQNSADTPYLVADQNQTVHALHAYPVDENDVQQAIFYSRWTLDQGWTTPVDILLSPTGSAIEIRGIFLDQNAVIHLLFAAGFGEIMNIYYARASAVNANNAQAWLQPELIGTNAIGGGAQSVLMGDDRGSLFVLYGGLLDGMGTYFIESSNNGSTWSDPMPIFWIYQPGLFTYSLQATIDQEQRLHAVWSVNNSEGQGQEIWYVRRENDSAWSEPALLTAVEEGKLTQVTDPAIAAYGDELFVIYSEWPDVPKRIMRSSVDGGITWAEGISPFETWGAYGEPIFLIDSNFDLHLILGDRARGESVWHSRWQQGHWQEPKPIVPLSVPRYEAGDPLRFHPTNPNAVISQGNVLLAVWRTDGTENGSWYSYRSLDAPALPVVPLTVPAIPTVVPTATVVTPVPISSPTRAAVIVAERETSRDTSSPIKLMIFGLAPTMLLVAAVVLVRKFFPYRRL